MLTDLHLIDFSRRDAWLFEEKNRRLAPTPLFWQLHRTVEMTRPALLCIDNRMRIFAGNQNDTVLATAVITELDALGFEFGMPVLLLSHPSLSRYPDRTRRQWIGRMGQCGTVAQLFPPPGKGS